MPSGSAFAKAVNIYHCIARSEDYLLSFLTFDFSGLERREITLKLANLVLLLAVLTPVCSP
jgi:hypothetical protein